MYSATDLPNLRNFDAKTEFPGDLKFLANFSAISSKMAVWLNFSNSVKVGMNSLKINSELRHNSLQVSKFTMLKNSSLFTRHRLNFDYRPEHRTFNIFSRTVHKI